MSKKPVNAISGKQGFQKTGRTERGKNAPTANPANSAAAQVDAARSDYDTAYAQMQPRPNPIREAIRGRTLAVREINGYNDSDFRALVEHENGAFGWITTGSTAVGGGFIAEADATDDVKARYIEWWERKNKTVQAGLTTYQETIPSVGKAVEVRGGRKHAGKTGEITWYGEDQFKSNRHTTAYRARIRTPEGEEFYVPADYLWVRNSRGEFVEAAETVRYSSQQIPPGMTAEALVFSEYPHPGQLR